MFSEFVYPLNPFIPVTPINALCKRSSGSSSMGPREGSTEQSIVFRGCFLRYVIRTEASCKEEEYMAAILVGETG